MNNKKLDAEKLRKEGLTYNEISRRLLISKSTLSNWFSNSSWSEEIKDKNKVTAAEVSIGRLLLMNNARKEKLDALYKTGENEAILLYKKYKQEPLFIAGLMLYEGEGDKSAKTGIVRISNSHMSVLKIFVLFCKKYLDIPEQKIKFWLLAYPEMNISEAESKWGKYLNITSDNFYKTQVIVGKSEKRLILGVH